MQALAGYLEPFLRWFKKAEEGKLEGGGRGG